MAVNNIYSVVDIEHYRLRGREVAGAVEVDHHAHQANQIA